MRNVVRFICLLLLPVFVMTTSTTAQATEYSETVSTSVGWDSWVPGSWGTCNLNGRYGFSADVPQLLAHVSMSCSWGWQIGDDMRDVSLTLNGDDCTASTSIDGPVATYQWSPVLSDPACHITEVCWDMGQAIAAYPDLGGSGCKTWDWGPPPAEESGSECANGEALAARASVTWDEAKAGYNRAALEWALDYALADNGETSWRLGVVFKYDGSSVLRVGTSGTDGDPGDGVVHYWTPNGTGLYEAWGAGQRRDWYPGFANADVIGLQVATHDNITHGAWRDFSGLPQDVAGGDLGVTRPESCLWYFGEEIADQSYILDSTGAATATPHAGLGPLAGGGGEEEPMPDPDAPVAPAASVGCDGFSVTDPSTWGGQAFCMIAHLLGRVVSALGSMVDALLDLVGLMTGLVADLVNAISELLFDIFVPRESFIEDQMDLIKADLDDSVVGNYSEAFLAQDYSFAAGGCEGIPVAWSMYGEDFDFDLLEACSGQMANVASIVKLVASAMLVIFGALACVRGVGSGVNWAPSLGDKKKGD